MPRRAEFFCKLRGLARAALTGAETPIGVRIALGAIARQTQRRRALEGAAGAIEPGGFGARVVALTP
jgi:hypothetical protein